MHRVLAIRQNAARSSWTATRRTAAMGAAKKEGDISSVFVSLSGGAAVPLPSRFANLKRQLVPANADSLRQSWEKLLQVLQEETQVIAEAGSALIPEIEFSNIDSPSLAFTQAHRRRGVAIVRGVVSEKQAMSWKTVLQDYIRRNPQTKGFPADKPAVYEIYWSRSQLQARAHPNLIKTQRFLMSHWHSNVNSAPISTKHPVAYADRLRIRQPGDTGFALGPHVDGGSCERWEPEGYGRGRVYDSIFRGDWEDYDPFESSCRLPVVSDLYNGAGACSMFRMYQGWLSLSHTSPGEGALLVNPLFSRATAYYLLRPFFTPKKEDTGLGYLRPDNWQLDTSPNSMLQGASLGHCQELNSALHPHLDLAHTMVHVPTVHPGDYIAWHCDTIHAVDSVHTGSTDSSVMYIPTCPLTEANVEYLTRQRQAFEAGLPGNDFPGGKGETEHVGRETPEFLMQSLSREGQRAMGFTEWDTDDLALSPSETKMLSYANSALGFT